MYDSKEKKKQIQTVRQALVMKISMTMFAYDSRIAAQNYSFRTKRYHQRLVLLSKFWFQFLRCQTFQFASEFAHLFPK